MKGLVFSEFLEFVEESFSPETADDIIDSSDLQSEGIYTSVGTYHHGELVHLVSALSEETKIAVPDLISAFGKHLFGRLTTIYPDFANSASNTFDFLRLVENYIHAEVLKLYPDAELPSFEFESPQPNRLIVIYHSKRALADLAHGMMEAAVEYFGETISIERDLESNSDGTRVKFSLTMKD